MTLISYRYKFIFLANMKCGSSTVHMYFKDYADEIYISSVSEKPLGRHDNAVKVKRYIEKKGYNWNEFYVFTTIRNPLTRIKSCYCYEKQKKRNLPTFEMYVLNNLFLKEHFTPLNRFAYKNRKLIVNKVIRLEELFEELSKIATQLNIQLTQNKRYNVGKRKRKLIFTDRMVQHLKSNKQLKCDLKYYKI